MTERFYTGKDYALKAIEANALGQKLYIYTHSLEYNVTVYEWNYEEKEVEQQVIDEEGNPVFDEEGNPKMETVTIQVPTTPIMVEEIVENPETGEEETILVQKSHQEKRTKEVAELVIAEPGYYVCYKDNYTDGTINEDFEQNKVQQRQEEFNNNFITTTWGAFRKTPKGYSSAVEAVNTVFNMVNIQKSFTEQLSPLLIFYEVPDFTKEEECTEEWLVEHQKTHEPCDLATFMQWYLEFQTIWAQTQYK